MNVESGITMAGVLDLVAAAILLVGLFFMFLGAVGIARFPDCYSKMHASSKCTTLGLTGMLLAVCLHLGDTAVVSKAVVTVVFTFVAMPIGSHLLAKAAHHVGVPLWDRTVGDELAEDKLDPTKATSDAELGCREEPEVEVTPSQEHGEGPRAPEVTPIRAA